MNIFEQLLNENKSPATSGKNIFEQLSLEQELQPEITINKPNIFERIAQEQPQPSKGFLSTTADIISEIPAAAASGLLNIPKGVAEIGRAGLETIGAETLAGGVEKFSQGIQDIQQGLIPKDLDDSTARKYAYEIVSNLGTNLPMLALGPVNALVGMGAVAFGNKYDELKEKGAGTSTAFLGGIGQSAIEVGTELMPVGILFKNMPIMKKALTHTLADVIGEEAATLGEAVLNKVAVNEDITAGELLQRIKDTAIVAGISGGITGTVVGKLTQKQKVDFEKNLSAAVQEPPKQPAPEAPKPEIPPQPTGLSTGQLNNENIVSRYDNKIPDFNKPQGLYTSFEKWGNPHEEEGNKKYLFEINKDSKILDVSDSKLSLNVRGMPNVPTSAGIKALSKLLPKETFNRLYSISTQMNKNSFANYLSRLARINKLSPIDFGKYYDNYEMLEGYSGALAKSKGYDAISDKGDNLPQFNEFVALTRGALNPISPAEQPSTQGEAPAGGISYGQKIPNKYAGGAGQGINLNREDADYDTKFYTNKLFEMGYQFVNQGKLGPDKLDDIEQEAVNTLAKGRYTIDNALKVDPAKKIPGKVEETMIRMLTTEQIAKAKAASRFAAETGLEEDRTEMEKHQDLALRLALISRNVGHEYSVGLSARRIMSQAQEYQKKQQVFKTMFPDIWQRMAGHTITEDVIDRLMMFDPSDKVGITKFINSLPKVETSDQLYEYWINSILSGPNTPIFNTLSNLITMTSNIGLEKPAAALIELGRTAVTGEQRQRFFREGLVGLHEAFRWQSIADAAKIFAQSFNTEISIDEQSQFETKGKIPRTGAIPGKAGRIIRVPTRLLRATDDFFKAIVFRSEQYSLAYRKARQEGLKDSTAITKRMQELIKSGVFNKEAETKMHYLTFSSELGKFARTVNTLIKEPILLGKYAPQKVIFPFWKSPVNIAKYGIEHTPLGFLKYFQKGADMQGAKLSDEMAAPLLGSAIMTTFLLLAKQGIITGAGPKDKNEKEALYRTGWQPYSVRIGDTWIKYERLEPLASVIGMAADLAEYKPKSDTEFKDYLFGAGFSLSKNLTSKTWMAGLNRFLDAVSDPQRYGENYIKLMTGSVVPNIVGQTTRMLNPELKRTTTIPEVIKERLPFARETVLPRRNIWGESIQASPLGISAEKESLVDKEMIRLGVFPGQMKQFITRRGMKVELTNAEYDELQQLIGKKLKPMLENVAKVRASDEAKKKRMEKIINDVRERYSTMFWVRYKARAKKGGD